jgi:hypothetical protein
MMIQENNSKIEQMKQLYLKKHPNADKIRFGGGYARVGTVEPQEYTAALTGSNCGIFRTHCESYE